MRRLLHHSISFHYPLFPKRLRWLFIGHLLRGAAEETVGLFVPIFLFSLGSELQIPFLHAYLLPLPWLFRGILIVSAHFFLYRLCALFLTLPLAQFIKWIGLMKSMVLGNLCSLFMYLSFYVSVQNAWFLLPATVFTAMQVILYWVPYHTQFAVRADLALLGQEIGAINFLNRLVRAGLPMFGGIVIGVFGFQVSYAVGIVLMLASSVCLLAVDEVKIAFSVSFREFIAWLRDRKKHRIVIALFGKYLDDCAIGLWSVYIFIFLGTVQRVGYVYSIVLFSSLIIAYFMGWYLGKHKSRKIFFLTGGLLSLLWMFRLFVQNLWHLIAVDLLDALAIHIYTPIYDLGLCLESRGRQVFHFYVFREITLSMVGIVFWLVIIGIFILPLQWFGVFILGGVGILMSLNMMRRAI